MKTSHENHEICQTSCRGFGAASRLEGIGRQEDSADGPMGTVKLGI